MANYQYGPQQPQYAQQAHPSYNARTEKASIGDIIIGFFFPVIGIIFYLLKKDKLANPETLLYSAGVGTVVDFILTIILCLFDL